jgi:fructose-bisphosphate aldolase class II
VLPLIEASEAEVKAGRNPIFQSHMWDGSAVPLAENLAIAKDLLPRMRAINSILEVEIGVVGGEEDGVSHEINEHLYTTIDDAIATVEALGLGENGRYMAALTFGNVHGVYKPGNVRLRPARSWPAGPPGTAPATRRSTSSSTADRDRPTRRSRPRWRTAW